METPSRFAAKSAYVAQDEALLLRLPGLPWPTSFLVSLLLCAGLALTPAQTEAAYAATELASLPVGSSHVVHAANDAGEIVGSARAHAVAISAPGVIVAIGVDEATSPEQRHDHDDHELPLRIFRLVRVP